MTTEKTIALTRQTFVGKVMSVLFNKLLNKYYFSFTTGYSYKKNKFLCTCITKVRLVKAMVFPVVMYGCELDCEES